MKAFQLKIVINDSKPPIWRRLIVPAGITFSQLSMILNEAMGWSGNHRFVFEFYHLELRIIEGAEEYGGGYGPYVYTEASTAFVREYLEGNGWFTYVYDLGFYWKHRVTVEKVIEDYVYEYPQVIKYKGNCPVEDCGGIYGYYKCLDIISDKNNPEYEDKLEWMKLQGYPNEYDMDDVNDEFKEYYFYEWGKGESRFQKDIYEDHLKGKCGLNASKRDKNKNLEIVRSGKHQMEDSLQKRVDLLKLKAEWEQALSHSALEDIFSDYEKEDIVEIAKVKGLRGISGYGKAALIDKLVKHMLQPEVFKQYLLCLTDCEMDAFEKIVSKGNISYNCKLKIVEKLYQAGYVGLLGTGSVVIPGDVAAKYQQLQGIQFHAERKKISYMLSCLRTAGLLYGIAPLNVIHKMLKINPEADMTAEEVRRLIENLPPEYAEYIIAGDKVYHKSLYPDDRGLLSAQGDKRYYIPTMEEINEIGIYGCLPSSKELIKLVGYLVKQLDMDPEQADFMGAAIQTTICSDCRMQDIINLLAEQVFKFKGEYRLDELMPLINDLWNNTRMILNRGFKPSELRYEDSLPPLPVMKTNNIINLEKARQSKVYPSDPCPCGSGRKYKNCCKNKI